MSVLILLLLNPRGDAGRGHLPPSKRPNFLRTGSSQVAIRVECAPWDRDRDPGPY